MNNRDLYKVQKIDLQDFLHSINYKPHQECLRTSRSLDDACENSKITKPKTG